MSRVTLAQTGAISANEVEHLIGITDLEIWDGPLGPTLYAAARGGGWVTAFDLGNGAGSAAVVDRWYIPQSYAQLETTDLVVRDVGAGGHLLMAGTAPTTLYALDVSYAVNPLGPLTAYAGSSFDMSTLSAISMEDGAQTALVARQDGGLATLRFSGNAAVSVSGASDAGGLAGLQADAVATAALNGVRYGVAVYGADNGIALLRADNSGVFHHIDSISVEDALWAERPDAVALTAAADGRIYAIVGASGTSSLTVLAIEADQLNLVDHVLDTRDTRFRHAQFIETAQIGGADYVFAAGTDGGLSVFALLPGGQLQHVAALSGTAALPLAGISGLEVLVDGALARIFVSSYSAPYLTELSFHVDNPGAQLVGTAGSDTRTGTSGDDILSGAGGADRLSGGAGDDILMDGTGTDTLAGQGGADTFVLDVDGAVDQILDFDPSQDRIELKSPMLVSGIDDVVITPKSWGAELNLGGERHYVFSASGQSLTAADFANGVLSVDQSISVDISAYPEPGRNTGPEAGSELTESYLIGALPQAPDWMSEPSEAFSGQGRQWTSRADFIRSGSSNDFHQSGAGADWVLPGAGDDRVDSGAGNDTVNASWGNDTVLGGDGFDTLLGVGGDDFLDGGAHADRLDGGRGNDRLLGRDGFDVLFGREGNDSLWGGRSPDRLYGGDGDDWISAGANFGYSVDGLLGNAGNDTLFGDGGFDHLDGGSGDDVLDGGHQADNLFGGIGDDTLIGNLGFDRLFGGAGDDVLDGGDGPDGHFGGDGNDRIFGGAGTDRFFAGAGDDVLDGGADADFLRGNAGFDTLIGGAGNDTLMGNFNADRFVFENNHGHDWVLDFDPQSALEVLDFSQLTAFGSTTDVLLVARQQGNDVIIPTSESSSIRLAGVRLEDIDGSDFLF